jgi:hypothetical protein
MPGRITTGARQGVSEIARQFFDASTKSQHPSPANKKHPKAKRGAPPGGEGGAEASAKRAAFEEAKRQRQLRFGAGAGQRKQQQQRSSGGKAAAAVRATVAKQGAKAKAAAAAKPQSDQPVQKPAAKRRAHTKPAHPPIPKRQKGAGARSAASSAEAAASSAVASASVAEVTPSASASASAPAERAPVTAACSRHEGQASGTAAAAAAAATRGVPSHRPPAVVPLRVLKTTSSGEGYNETDGFVKRSTSHEANGKTVVVETFVKVPDAPLTARGRCAQLHNLLPSASHKPSRGSGLID